MSNPTDVGDFIAALDGGVFDEKISKILSEVAAAAIDHERAGKVVLTFDMKRIGNSYQVQVDHKLTYKKPTAKGDITENNATSTPMHVGTGGKMTLFPESQVPEGQTHLFDKDNPNKLVTGGSQ